LAKRLAAQELLDFYKCHLREQTGLGTRNKGINGIHPKSPHSAALGIFSGGLPPDDYSIRLAKAIAAVTTYPYPPINVGCVYTGGFTDWANEEGIAALDVELTDHTHTDFEMNLKVLETFLNWKW
jgi:hypothetical protein